jgi:hypothetical protein
MPSKKAKRKKKQQKEMLDKNFVTLVLLSIVCFIIGALSNYGPEQRGSFVMLSLMLLLLGVIIQYRHIRSL